MRIVRRCGINVEQVWNNTAKTTKSLARRDLLSPAWLVGPPDTYLLAEGDIRTFVLEMQLICKIIVNCGAWPRFSCDCVLVRNSAIPEFCWTVNGFLGAWVRLHRLEAVRGFLLWYVLLWGCTGSGVGRVVWLDAVASALWLPQAVSFGK